MEVISTFGVNSGAPSVVMAQQAGTFLFARPINTAPGMGTSTPARRGIADMVLPFQTLNAPGNGVLNGQRFQVKATGNATVPAGAVSPTFNLVLASNTFSQVNIPFDQPNRNGQHYSTGGTTVTTITSVTMATLASAQSLTPGTTVPFSITVDLSGTGDITLSGISTLGGGVNLPNPSQPPFQPPGTTTLTSGSTILGGTQEFVIAGVDSGIQNLTNPVTNWSAFANPSLCLTLGAVFGGTLADSTRFVATLDQWMIQA